jgi:hypothetical protein
MQQLANEVAKGDHFGNNGWDYTFSLSEKPADYLTTLTVYRKISDFPNPTQTEVGHVDINSVDLAYRNNKFDHANFLFNHVKEIVLQYERAEMMAGMNVNIDQWYRDEARREVEAEYAATLTSLGVNLSAYSTTGMDAIVNQQARLLKAQRENNPNVGFLASELSAMKHSFAATARQEAQRDAHYPSRLSTPLGVERTQRNEEHRRQRLDRSYTEFTRRSQEAARRSSRIIDQYSDYTNYDDLAKEHPLQLKPVVPKKMTPITEKVRQTDLFEDTGRKFRID